MTSYWRMSMLACWALARASGRMAVLKAMTTASEAMARSMSAWVTSPTPPRRRRMATSCWGSLVREAVMASKEPWTSHFMMMFSSLRSPDLIRWAMLLRESLGARRPPIDARRLSRTWPRRFSAMALASSNGISSNSSPASGTPLRPRTSTADEGPASWTLLRPSPNIARTLPYTVPQTTVLPTRSVPFWTSSDATEPISLSTRPSMQVPFAALDGLAKRSSTSETREIISSRVSMPSPLMALIGTMTVEPPQSSGMRPCSVSSCLTLSGLAPSLSILLMATTMGTRAAWACLMASIVCGLTPSSAATTRTAMSVTFAPRERMAVKASWPGVSRNTIGFSWPLISIETW
mmetsp:Transcript_13700/g.23504  ORF Transcript_13700/g.23504 Transcript_13700/m.23504 type:complete len:349 (-) Transcript_13700:1421-2467(-)